jgi:hypothetical protein
VAASSIDGGRKDSQGRKDSGASRGNEAAGILVIIIFVYIAIV